VPAIPHADTKAQYAPLIPELLERFGEVLESGQFILGPHVRAFEAETAAYLGVPRTIGVGNGTDAITLVLEALRVGAGDEVICPAFTFYATAEPVARARATPVFADIDPATLNLDPDDVAAKITPRTKAIMAVHLFGRPAPLRELALLGPPVIEDAAQAFGAKGIAKTGVASTFSFYPSKNLFALGDGGLVAVTDDELGDRIWMLHFHGSRDKQRFDYVGTNSRLDELQAAALRLFLPHVDTWNVGRRRAAARYEQLGLGEVCELPRDEPGHVYHMYCVRTAERDRLREALREAEIGHAVHYATPLHLQPAFSYLGYAEGDLPETERASRENLCLPLWPSISREQQERVVSVVSEAAAVRAA
jgi:dTDP-4-amino-4,6-dideoxygalactose transaminase